MSIVEPGMEVMLETFIHETETMLEQLDEILLDSERAKSLTEENINDIFRITHTIKGSAAMMSFNGISNLAHAVEDVFYALREDPGKLALVFDGLFDLILATSDFLKAELEKLMQQEDYQEGNPDSLIQQLHAQANLLNSEEKSPERPVPAATAQREDGELFEGNAYRIRVFFEDDCQMENMRAFMLMSQLQHCCDMLDSRPQHPESDSAMSAEIVKSGFLIICKPAGALEDVYKTIEGVLSVKSYEVLEDEASGDDAQEIAPAPQGAVSLDADVALAQGTVTGKPAALKTGGAKQSLISVNQGKLDHLMDLVGELVTAESMVNRNPDLEGLRLDNLTKSLRELRKLTDELQDIVMSIRMVPLQGTFHKMDRIVRDMSKKLGKPVELITEGGDTEVDKTINDAIVDPLMHMIRNAMDHAIEPAEERAALHKPEAGQITLTARNIGGEIHIDIADDGRGLNPEALLEKAKKNGILTKPESEYSDKEAFNLILLPGFSTNEIVTEFSGRGVGMDVVRKNVEMVGGTISISSVRGQGTTFSIKIPLTLAIVDGMNISVGNTVFTLPITSIRQSFKISDAQQILHNTNGTEMLMLRGECYPVFRLHEIFGIPTETQEIVDGIMIQVESSDSSACVFADALLGEYQVVVKPFPTFFNQYNLKEHGLSGCSILGDGSISLILDANSLLSNQ